MTEPTYTIDEIRAAFIYIRCADGDRDKVLAALAAVESPAQPPATHEHFGSGGSQWCDRCGESPDHPIHVQRGADTPQPAEHGPALHETDERLIAILRSAGDEWGPTGVARAAALLVAAGGRGADVPTTEPAEEGWEPCPAPAMDATTRARRIPTGVASAEPNSPGPRSNAGPSPVSRDAPAAGSGTGATTSTNSPPPTIGSRHGAAGTSPTTPEERHEPTVGELGIADPPQLTPADYQRDPHCALSHPHGPNKRCDGGKFDRWR